MDIANELVQQAKQGNRDALELLMTEIQPRLYNLSVRMLWHPHDAEDATQEILIKILTRLNSFRGDSAFMTWAWRVAVNHLLNVRKQRAQQSTMSFEAMGHDLSEGLSDNLPSVAETVDRKLLIEEAKIGCMQAMLQCLKPEERLAYILGEIMGIDHQIGAEIFQISPSAYRKRVSRARKAIRDFMMGHCGLMRKDNPCRCHKRINVAIEKGRIQPENLLFAQTGEDDDALREKVAQLDETARVVALFQTHPDYQPQESFTSVLTRLLDSGDLSFLN